MSEKMLERFFVLYLRYKRAALRGVEAGNLYFNSEQVIEASVLRALHHLDSERSF